jgi:hypothetical protein
MYVFCTYERAVMKSGNTKTLETHTRSKNIGFGRNWENLNLALSQAGLITLFSRQF